MGICLSAIYSQPILQISQKSAYVTFFSYSVHKQANKQLKASSGGANDVE